MFSTIYMLVWEQQNLVYIGRSKNINTRISSHTRAMEGGWHYNHKIQQAYNTFGKFTSVCILDTVLEEIANTVELKWIAEFNSVEEGLNLVGYEVTYTEFVIEKVLNRDTSIISKYTLVSPKGEIYYIDKMIDFVNNTEDLAIFGIAASKALIKVCSGTCGSYHGYRKYNAGSTLPNRSHNRYNYTVYNDYESFNCINLLDFCTNHPIFKENSFASTNSLKAVANGIRPTHKGYKCSKQLISTNV